MAYEAGRIVAELEARNGQFDASMRNSAAVTDQSMSRVERSAASAERAIARSSSVIVSSQGQVSQATRNLGFQLSDVGQQLSGGQSSFVIFGQQAPQFVQAFDDIAASGARVGTVLRAVALPGILAVISVLATLIERQVNAADASNTHAKAADFLKEAVDRLAGASARSNHQTELGIAIDIRAAEAKRQNAIRTRQLIEAELNKQRGELSAAQATEGAAPGALGIPGRGSASRQANIDDVNRQLRDNANAIKGYDQAIASGRSQLVLRGVAAATDATTAANQRYERSIDRLRRAFDRGQISESTLARLATAATRQRDASLETAKVSDRASSAARSHGVSLRIQNDGAREAAAAQRELESTLSSLIQKYDPLAAAAAQYATELKNIAALEKGGKLDPVQADRLREGAGSAYRKTRADAFNLPFVEGLRPGIEQDEKDAKDAARAQEEAARDAERATQAAREQNIRSLANIYEDVFTRSSGQVWENFKRDGLRALAVVLARATVASFASGGGGFGSLLSNIGKAASSAFAGTPGYATGGTMLIGGRGGTDQNLLSLNGWPIAAVSRGETLNINPNTQAARSQPRGGATVLQTISVDARGAVMNDAFASQILARANQGAQQIVTANNGVLRKSLPAAQTRLSQLGTTG